MAIEKVGSSQKSGRTRQQKRKEVTNDDGHDKVRTDDIIERIYSDLLGRPQPT